MKLKGIQARAATSVRVRFEAEIISSLTSVRCSLRWMSFYIESIPLSAEPCCDCLTHPAGFATWCYPAGAGAAGLPASSPTPAGISLGL